MQTNKKFPYVTPPCFVGTPSIIDTRGFFEMVCCLGEFPTTPVVPRDDAPLAADHVQSALYKTRGALLDLPRPLLLGQDK